MPKLTAGDPAPDFSLLDQAGRTVRRADFLGKRLVVYFYPRADTPGCTRQACSVRDHRAELLSRGLQTLGISPDPPERQAKFDQKYSLGFTLLSDPDHRVAQAYGAWGEKKQAGNASEGIIRSSLLIDEQGKIVEAWYQVKPEDTVPNALNLIG